LSKLRSVVALTGIGGGDLIGSAAVVETAPRPLRQVFQAPSRRKTVLCEGMQRAAVAV
jgi:hypothetical protein